jgi:chromosome segregation ATPase
MGGILTTAKAAPRAIIKTARAARNAFAKTARAIPTAFMTTQRSARTAKSIHASRKRTQQNAESALRRTLSQTDLRKERRRMKVILADYKYKLKGAKNDYKKAKELYNTKPYENTHLTRAARNDAEDEVDRFEDKIHEVEKDLRKLRKHINYADKSYRNSYTSSPRPIRTSPTSRAAPQGISVGGSRRTYRRHRKGRHTRRGY